MADSNKRVQPYTSFNAGEYSPELAGRVDLESFGSSSRFMSNMMSQVSGGIKKFYGTTHIAEKQLTEGVAGVKMIPFINKHEPMVLVFWGIDRGSANPAEQISVGLIYGDEYEDLNITLPSSININELRWKQINDVIIFAHESVQPLGIKFYGLAPEGSQNKYLFTAESIVFDEVPYFPIGSKSDYNGELEASGISGQITISIPEGEKAVRSTWPAPLVNTSTYTRYWSSDRTSHWLGSGFTVTPSTVSLYRTREGVDTLLCTGVCDQSNMWHDKGHSGGHTWYTYTINNIITRERILQVIRSVYPESYLYGDEIILRGVDDNVAGDEYYLHLNVGQIVYTRYGGVIFPSAQYDSVPYVTHPVSFDEFNAEDYIGRKIKFFFNDDTVVSPWWQGKTVAIGNYAYSNGHWYKAQTAGTCGNIQPSHTFGMRSDGGVTWLYVHSGSGTGTVIASPSEYTFTVLISQGEIPANWNGTTYTFKNYAWSIWGKDGIHPSEVYMAGNRLGFVCNTNGYGAWNSLSVTDDYYNFSTEEYGEQLDTSAIVHLIGNNEAGAINWVLSRKNVYMGSYSGEFNVQGGDKGIFTPTGTVVENISNMGGKAVVPLKYKELNMFVGITGKELYTIGYDYTIDDYTPHSLGYMTEHLMERGVCRIEALNNLDRNIYLLHDTNQLSLFNYAREQKIMGFSELDFDAPVIDYVTTSANDVVAGYVATVRNDGKITLERLAITKPTYMWDVIEVGDGEMAVPITGVTHFAGKEVWVKYGDGQFMRTTLDENGDAHGVPMMNKYEIGLPMVAELHTQPAFGMKVEGHQQQSLYACLRLNETGSFEYGASVDFKQYFPYKYWNNEQEWDAAHRLYTGDAIVNIPLGYAENANQGEGPYPNTTGVGINLRSDTPEPFNLLSIQEIYK